MKSTFGRMGSVLLGIGSAAGMGLLACATGCVRPYGVPPFSQLVAEAPGQAASFQAPDNGTVFVAGPGRPGEARHVVFTGGVHRGDVVTVDPARQKLTLNGAPQDVSIFDANSFYQLWFKPLPREIQ